MSPSPVLRPARVVALAALFVGCAEPDAPRRPTLEVRVVPPAAVFCLAPPAPAPPPAPEGNAPPSDAAPPPPPDAPPADVPAEAPAPGAKPALPAASPEASPPPAPGLVAPPPPPVAATQPAEPPPAAKPDPKTCDIDCSLTCGSPICERQADSTVACSRFEFPAVDPPIQQR